MKGSYTKKATGYYHKGHTTKSWHQNRYSCPEGRHCDICSEGRKLQDVKLKEKFEDDLEFLKIG